VFAEQKQRLRHRELTSAREKLDRLAEGITLHIRSGSMNV